MVHLLTDQSQESTYLQKMILKIFYVLVQVSLNLTMMSLEDFARWMELIRQIVDRPVPQETLTVDEEERPELVWWKCKKWALHIMSRIFERYGNPGQVANEYKQFADYYLKNFVSPSTQTVLKVLDSYRNKEYISPRVMFLALSYLQTAVGHAFSWKFLKPHFAEILRDIIFPLACHNEKDEELWQDDPQEYIRTKYDLFDELTNPTRAAIAFLSACMKRGNLLSTAVQFICAVLNNPASTPQQYDGALHIIGSLAPNLLKKKVYKNELENMLVAHVFPRFSAAAGFLRARACWCVQTFSQVPFKNDVNLAKSLELVVNALLHDTDLPVKVEGSIAMQMLLSDQPKVEPMIETQIRPIIIALLKLISETENDDLTTVVQKLIATYTVQIVPVAQEIAQNLANIFIHLLQSEDGAEDRAITAIGVLNTLETVMDAVEENAEMTASLEPIVISVIRVIFDNNVMDFYEEAMNLIYSLTMKQITPAGWELFGVLCDIFAKDAIDYFTDMMPALHNYITVDPQAFLALPLGMGMIFNMCKRVLKEDVGEDAQCHAGKLLEVLVLQFRGKIDTMIRPICELVLSCLTTEIKTSELRTMFLQDLIAILHYNPKLMLETLQTFQSPDSPSSLIDTFIKQWLFDTDCFLGLHDRKMCLIGLTILMGIQDRPQVMAEVSNDILPSCLTLFEGLQKAYESKALRENGEDDEDSGEEEEEDLDASALASDEDEINDEAQQYLEKLAKSEQDSGNDDDYSDSEDYEFETDLESFDTVLDGESAEVDEYILFKETLFNLQHVEPVWYTMLVGQLTADQIERLQKVFSLADQRKAAAESKKIDQSGGYQFNVQQIPTTFNFGGGAF
jgi:hypothetical protein